MSDDQDVQKGQGAIQTAVLAHHQGVPLKFEWSELSSGEYQLHAVNSVTNEVFFTPKFSRAELADWRSGALEQRVRLASIAWKAGWA